MIFAPSALNDLSLACPLCSVRLGSFTWAMYTSFMYRAILNSKRRERAKRQETAAHRRKSAKMTKQNKFGYWNLARCFVYVCYSGRSFGCGSPGHPIYNELHTQLECVYNWESARRTKKIKYTTNDEQKNGKNVSTHGFVWLSSQAVFMLFCHAYLLCERRDDRGNWVCH